MNEVIYITKEELEKFDGHFEVYGEAREQYGDRKVCAVIIILES